MPKIEQFERHMQGQGFAFPGRGGSPDSAPKQRGPARKRPEFRDPESVNLPPYKPGKAREPGFPDTRRVVSNPAEVGCTAKAALSDYYPAAAFQAEQRLKAGHRQGLCGICGRYRWADEVCQVAVFVSKPRWRMPLEGAK